MAGESAAAWQRRNPISRETTIEGGTIDTEFLRDLIEYLCERVGSTLRGLRTASALHRIAHSLC